MSASYDIFRGLKPPSVADQGQIAVISIEKPGISQDRYLPMDLQVLQMKRFLGSRYVDIQTATLAATTSVYTLRGAMGPDSPKLSRKGETQPVSEQESQHPLIRLTDISERYGNEGIILLDLAAPGIEDVAEVMANSIAHLRSTKDRNRLPAVGIVDQGRDNRISKSESGLNMLLGNSALAFTIGVNGYLAHIVPGAASKKQTRSRAERTSGTPAEKPDDGTVQF